MIRRVISRTACQHESASTLVVALHGCSWMPSRRITQMASVVDAIRQKIPDADVIAPLLPIEFWSLEDADDVAAAIVTVIDDAWATRERKGRPYSRVLLVGFSFGSVLIRQVYCRAAGARPDATLTPEPFSPWVPYVDRMVLLAGLNRGWTTDSPVTRLQSWANAIGTAIGHLLPRKPTLFAIRRGAPFLTRTRLQWHALERGGRVPRLTVQLLGTRDDIVSPTDNIDLATGRGFLYLEVAESSHFDVIEMPPTTDVGRVRRQRFLLALAGTDGELRAEAVDGPDLLNLLPIEADPTGVALFKAERGRKPTDVVFVVHGIRDKGYWTRKVSRVVTAMGRDSGKDVLAIAPTYGYFAMLPFILPWTRRAKIEWLLDMYVNARCWHPDARVSYVGHSNGTFIMAGAVEACSAVRFHEVVFAGSVVRSTFDWSPYVSRGQVRRVLNYVATADWVVAFFPRLIQRLGLQPDLGGAGYDGFDRRSAGVTDVKYVAGRHSAALAEGHWPAIACFVLGGPPPCSEVDEREGSAAMTFVTGLTVWVVIAAFVAVPTYLFLLALGVPAWTAVQPLVGWKEWAQRTAQPWVWTIGLTVWWQTIWSIATRL